MNNQNLAIEERESLFLKRTEYYLSQGYDRIKAAEFIVNCGVNLESPALDIGAGKGVLSIALAKKGLNVTGVDINDYDLQLARHLAKKEGLGERIQFFSLDAKNLPFKEKSFKTVAMMNVLHHLEEKDGEKIFSEMKRVMDDSGKMIIAEFDEKGFEIVAKAHKDEGSVHLTSGFTIEKAVSFLQNEAFAISSTFNSFCNNIVVLRKML